MTTDRIIPTPDHWYSPPEDDDELTDDERADLQYQRGEDAAFERSERWNWDD